MIVGSDIPAYVLLVAATYAVTSTDLRCVQFPVRADRRHTRQVLDRIRYRAVSDVPAHFQLQFLFIDRVRRRDFDLHVRDFDRIRYAQPASAFHRIVRVFYARDLRDISVSRVHFRARNRYFRRVRAH